MIELTTNSPASHYGIPVLRIDGDDYGPADSIEHTRYAHAGGTAGTAGCFVAAAANAGEMDLGAARAFCAQWPDGPQPDP